MPSQIKLFKIISLDTFIQLLLLSLSLFPSLTHTHATYLSFNDPQIQQRHHLHFNLSFPIHVTSSPFDQSLSFTRNPQRKDPLFCTSISPSRSSLYTLFLSIFIVCFHFSDPGWIPNKPSNGIEDVGRLESKGKEKLVPCSTGVGRYTVPRDY